MSYTPQFARTIVTPVSRDAIVIETSSCQPIYSDVTFWIYLIVVALLVIWGGAVTRSNMSWSDSLNQPSFRPPAFFFIFIWIILYFILAFSTYLCVNSMIDSSTRLMINVAFAINVVLNFVWLYVFYVQKNIRLAFWVLMLLLLGTLWLTYLLWSVNTLAGSLMMLYVIWLIVAAAYSWQLIQLNPSYK